MFQVTKISSQNSSYSVMVDEKLTATASSILSLDGAGSFNVNFSTPELLYKDDQAETALDALLGAIIAEGKKKYQEQLDEAKTKSQ